jgi:hypothetical protein
MQIAGADLHRRQPIGIDSLGFSQLVIG